MMLVSRNSSQSDYTLVRFTDEVVPGRLIRLGALGFCAVFWVGLVCLLSAMN